MEQQLTAEHTFKHEQSDVVSTPRDTAKSFPPSFLADLRNEAWEAFKFGDDDYSKDETGTGLDKILLKRTRADFEAYWNERLKTIKSKYNEQTNYITKENQTGQSHSGINWRPE